MNENEFVDNEIHCPFLRRSPTHHDRVSRDYYAKISEVIEGSAGSPSLFIFEAAEVRWTTQIMERQNGPINDFSESRLAIISLPMGRALARSKVPNSFLFELFEQFAGLPGVWLKFKDVREDTNGVPALRRLSLDAEDARVSFSSIELVEPSLAARLETAFGLEDLAAPDEKELEKFFGLLDDAIVDHARVYDVGQGLAQAICDSSGVPLLYLDYGCGVGPNRFTRPAGLKNFCFTSSPPILLSHWDWDHWAAHLIDPAGLHQTWLAPVQSVGAIHRAFLVSLRHAGGTMYRWAYPSGQAVTFGRLEIGQCTGAGRNNSGLAVRLAPAKESNLDPILFSGDADYTYHPFGSASPYHAIVVPHHGGRLRAGSPIPPPSPANQNRRLVYSYGASNTYNHPFSASLSAHRAVGWTKTITRETSARPPCGKPAHVEIQLLGPLLMSVPCGGTGCQLETIQ